MKCQSGDHTPRRCRGGFKGYPRASQTGVFFFTKGGTYYSSHMYKPLLLGGGKVQFLLLLLFIVRRWGGGDFSWGGGRGEQIRNESLHMITY